MITFKCRIVTKWVQWLTVHCQCRTGTHGLNSLYRIRQNKKEFGSGSHTIQEQRASVKTTQKDSPPPLSSTFLERPHSQLVPKVAALCQYRGFCVPTASQQGMRGEGRAWVGTCSKTFGTALAPMSRSDAIA